MARPVLTVVVCLCALAAFAGASQNQVPPVFRSSVELVELEVSVLDKERRPVRGLKATDFTVLDDRRAQRITAFAEVDVPAPAPPATGWWREVAPDVQTNEDAARADSRLFVILIDDALIPFDPQAIKTAKAIAHRVIDQANPSDRIAVVFSAGSDGTQNFTNDRKRLLAAVETLNPTYAVYTMGWNTARPPDPPGVMRPEPPGPASDPDSMYRMASMRTLKMVAESLVAAPQRRKVLVHISPGIIVDTTSAAAPVRGALNVRMALKEENAALFREMPNLYDQLKKANVNVYVMDPCGLGGLERYVLSVVSQIPVLRMVTGSPPPGFDFLAPTQPPPPVFLAKHVSGLSRDFALTTAANTGGFAVVDSNDFEPGIARLFVENASYYVLGYALPAGYRPGSQHRVQVGVNRPDTDVRARTGYTVPAVVTPPREGAGSGPLARAVSGPVAVAALRLRAALAPIATPNGATVAIALAVELPPVTTPAAHMVELDVSVFTPDGRPRGSTRTNARIPLPPSSGSEPVHYDLLFDHPLSPGRYEFRLGAERGADRLVGAVYADVEVPDFPKAPLSLSGVFVEATPLPPSGPRSHFKTLVPVVPTTKRQFDRTEGAVAFLRVYQGGAAAIQAASARVRIIDQHGAVVTDMTDTLALDRFDRASKSADVFFKIPIAKLAAGDYLLGIDVTAGSHQAARTVRFQVR